jgi:hypothetical protein
MITTPTVFVLGAGASVDFGFPAGLKLLQMVVDFKQDTPGRRTMLELGWDVRQLGIFCDALRYSADASIDAFLEKRPEFMDIGKVCMAVALIACEQTPTIFGDPGGLNWIKYLFRRMQGESFERFGENAVSFVTFNFDRVLEHFLCTALQNAWGRTEEAAGAILNKIPIIHLHGQLGFLPWQAGKKKRPFNTTIDAQSLRIAADGIKVVHEGVEDRKQQFGDAKAAILGATRTYFLGVGTSNVNFHRLGVAEFEKDKAWATERGLTDAEFTEASSRYNPLIQFQRHTDCSQMISNFVRWD